MKIIFSQEEIDNYLKQRPEGYHPFYKTTIEIAESMAVHADGFYPAKLIEERRPNEPIEVKDYRKIIWKPKTKPTFSKVFNELQKIRRSSDWSIKFENLEAFTKIRDGESIEDYTMTNFPHFESVTNWAFTLMLRRYLIDPNSVCVVMPLSSEVEENEYLQPFPVIYDSKDVIDYVPGDFVVINDPIGTFYFSGKARVKGRRVMIITTRHILIYDQVNGRGGFNLVTELEHGLETLPAFSLKGVLIGQMDQHFLYESRLAGMIPELDEAVREYSDLQAAIVLHIYPERWEFAQNECTSCKGTGMRPNPSYTGPGCGCEPTTPCTAPNCNRGYVSPGPYAKLMVRAPNNATEGTIMPPMPPGGFLEKDVEIIKLQQAGVKQHLYEALAAINFEFLAEVPLAQSGLAKDKDMDALNNTVHAIAEDLVAVIDWVMRLSAMWRYKEIYPFDEIENMLPSIPVPEKYAILSSARTMDELIALKEAKANPVLISATEDDLASKRFNSDPGVRDAVQLTLKLDPLPNVTEDDKMSRLSNKGITQETYVISSNIQEFIQRAIEADKDFAGKDLKEQKLTLAAMAKLVIDANDSGMQEANKIINDAIKADEPIVEDENAAV